MFKRLDLAGDNRLSLEEFKQAVPALTKWGVNITDPEQAFKEIDADGSGSVLFDEFCMFAVANDLDIEDDHDFRMTPEDLELLRHSKILIDEQANSHKGPHKDNKLNDDLSKKSKKYD